MTRSLTSTRRKFLQLGLTALAGFASMPALAILPSAKGLRELAFHNLPSGEKLRAAYWRDGTYDRQECEKINYILRDSVSGAIYPINLRLIDLLYDLQSTLGDHGAIEVVSGYRPPRATPSYHATGMAIDLRMSGTPLPKIYQAALALRRGGVGYYPDAEFVHIDVGPIVLRA